VEDVVEMTRIQSRTVEQEPASRGVLRSQHQAIVVVERRMGRADDPKAEQMAPGWSWVLGNARIGELFDQLFAEARLTWSSLVVPEEQHATFSELCAPVSAPQSFVAYDGRLQINRTSLTTTPEDGEPLYLIFNGHRFPICDLRTAIEVHRQNRCDATLIDFPQPRKKAYDEKFQIDGEGRVKKVDRSYGRERDTLHADRDWPVLIVMSSQAMKAMMDVSLPHRINQWPGAMLRAGLHLRGGTIPGRSYSLHDREHLFELNEAILRNDPQWLARAGGLEDQGQKVWVGKNVKIDSTANVIGPVVIGDDVEIGKDAVIVGPTTIGRGAKIGAGIILKRAVVLPRTTLASATLKAHTLSHAIVLGEDTPSVQAITQVGEASDAPDGDDSADLRTLSFERPIKLEKVLESQMAPLTGFQYRSFRHAKRAVDIVGSLVALICTMPMWPFLALGIKLNSPGGPIFYGAVRQGRGGKNFRCWKFRTMKPDAEKDQFKLRSKNEVDGPQFKMKDDPRIFKLGRIMRKLNLDELPQFWNVLIGQMSIVGPRPSPEKENQMCPAWREARLSVRPGITGLWQVSRKRDRDDTDFQEWIYYDVQYIKKQSIWLDFKIIFKTLLVAMGGGQ
jgi:lipopolysaccharide/colanic/teichoic acid biosynthesis glycosyltransferase/carbonic anhydrase/acetyltransferase-like protein (isoleucine patch superfamily)